jgi:hypothetical protein
LSGSQAGVSYQLLNGSNATVQVAKSGNGSPLTWTGVAAGNGYHVLATAGSCSSQTANANVTSSATPTVFSVAGSSICSSAPNTGTITLSGSQVGVNYQLRNSSNVNVQVAKPGTGSSMQWTGIGAANGYRIVATFAAGSCSSSQTGTANVTSVASPTVYTLTGSSICSNAPNTGTVKLSNSQSGVSYQLFNSSNAPVQSPKPGTGSALTWTGLATGNGYYAVATNNLSCTSQTATANVTSIAPPTASIFYLGNPFCTSNTSAINPTRTGQAGGTYFATPAGLNINISNGSIKPKFSTPGTYTVTYTFSNGTCTNTTTTTVTIVNCANTRITEPVTTDTSSSVSNPKLLDQTTAMGIKVWPLPSESFFNMAVKSSSKEAILINVYDITGKRIQQLRGSPLETYRFGDTYVAGGYVVEVIQGKDRITQKILKQ